MSIQDTLTVRSAEDRNISAALAANHLTSIHAIPLQLVQHHLSTRIHLSRSLEYFLLVVAVLTIEAL